MKEKTMAKTDFIEITQVEDGKTINFNHPYNPEEVILSATLEDFEKMSKKELEEKLVEGRKKLTERRKSYNHSNPVKEKQMSLSDEPVINVAKNIVKGDEDRNFRQEQEDLLWKEIDCLPGCFMTFGEIFEIQNIRNAQNKQEVRRFLDPSDFHKLEKIIKKIARRRKG